ncbi:MAG: FAD-dependent oxidoreductase [Deltaproteobacteria bacterium]|nr:FAD-dependent oxidoreductase [Deltaproteobacteria bacterium]
MSSTAKPPIAILGAGLTGLSAAHHLGSDYQVYERLGHVGGHAITLEERGYRFDRTGHLLHLRDPGIRAWMSELFAEGHLRTIHRRSLVFSHGKYTRYPYQANTFGLPAEVAFECLKGYLTARETSWESAPANFEEFCLQNFGEGFSKHFMIPYNARLWGVHPREITAEWCSRFVPMPKLDDVLAGAVGLNDRELGYNASFLYPPTGIQELPVAMAARIGNVTLNRAPSKIDWRNKRLHFSDGDTHDYQSLITTAPLKSLIGLLDDAPAEIVQAANKLRCNKLWYLDVATHKPCLKDLHWAYIPEDKYPFYRIGCYSNFSEQLAPKDGACFYVELADRNEPDMATLGPRIARDMVEMGLIASVDDILFMSPRVIQFAYVVFDHDYFSTLDVIKPFLIENNILSHGRYGAWNYSSMEDALIYGRQAATSAREMLR